MNNFKKRVITLKLIKLYADKAISKAFTKILSTIHNDFKQTW